MEHLAEPLVYRALGPFWTQIWLRATASATDLLQQRAAQASRAVELDRPLREALPRPRGS